VVKVVDFGIAKATGADAGSQKVTKTGLVVGTPEYMSPEQLAGDVLDGRTDIYSLALVFYRMITGALPFKAETSQELMIKRLTDDPLPLAVTVPEAHFPAGLQAVMDRALARWPNDRYDTAAHFGRDVSALAGALTGAVDTEGATKLFKRASGAPAPTVPATRVDPAVAAERNKPGATPAAPTAAAAAPTPVPVVSAPARRFPVLPVAAAVTVLVLGGAGFAFRRQLFGGPPAAGTQQPADSGAAPQARNTATSPPAPTPGTNPATAQPSEQTDQSKVAIPPASGGSKSTADSGKAVVTPPKGGPGPSAPAGGGRSKISAPLPELDDILNPGTRDVARQKAEAIYARTEVVDSIRADAASLVGQAYNEDHKFADAKGWFERAAGLFPRELYQRLILDAERNMAKSGQN
jgi:hypothetical protein